MQIEDLPLGDGQEMPPGMIATDMTVAKNHDGTPCDQGDIFFGDLQGQIGEILSGTTNVNRAYKSGVRNPWGAARIGLGILGLIVGAIGGIILGESLTRDDTLHLVMIIAGGVIGFLMLSLPVQPKHACSVVGSLGVAQFKRKGWNGRAKGDVFPFSQGGQLRTQQTTHYTNGVYSGDSINFAWYNANGGKVFSIVGRYYRNKKRGIPRDNPVNFAWAAERAWSLYRLPQVINDLDQGRSVRFSVGKKDWIGIGRGRIELGFKGQQQELANNEIQNITLARGFMTIAAVGSKKGLFSNQGITTFSVAQTQDFRLFLLVLENETGIRVG